MRAHILFVLSLLALLISYSHALHVTTSGYGPETVAQQSGYMDIPGHLLNHKSHIWYWFFESRNHPETAPLVIWLTGGPGCSSSTALFAENGPYFLSEDLTLTINPNSWNKFANVIWVDQPTGTGFSYMDSFLDYDLTEEDVSIELYQFLQKFLEKNPQYANRPLFITGESYAGHYNPHFSNFILRMNAGSQNPKINLQGVAIGNGWVDPLIQYGEYANFMHHHGLLSNFKTFFFNNAIYPVCAKALSHNNFIVGNTICNALMQSVLKVASLKAHRSINVYDIRATCAHPPLCYNFDRISRFFASVQVQQALGVSPGFKWQECSMKVNLVMLQDRSISFAHDVAAVANAGVRVLIYSGQYDFICNSFGALHWIREMNWNQRDNFNQLPMLSWTHSGQSVGSGKTLDNFTWLEVFNAGHMVPMDQPENSLDMFHRFIDGRPYF